MSWGLLGGLGKGVAAAGQAYGTATGNMAMAQWQDERATQREKMLAELRHKYRMNEIAAQRQMVNDGQGNVWQVGMDGTASPVMAETQQPYQMPEGSYFDEEDRQQVEGGLLSTARQQLNVGGDQGRFQPFEHPELGWVQQGPDGKLHQFDPKKMPGGDGGSGRLPGGLKDSDLRAQYNMHLERIMPRQDAQFMAKLQDYKGRYGENGLSMLMQEYADAPDYHAWVNQMYGMELPPGHPSLRQQSQQSVPAEMNQAPQVTAETARAQAESEAREKHPGNGLLHINRRKRYVEERTKELITQGGEPARPTTDAQFDALPSGAIYIDPDDGKPYRKP